MIETGPGFGPCRIFHGYYFVRVCLFIVMLIVLLTSVDTLDYAEYGPEIKGFMDLMIAILVFDGSTIFFIIAHANCDCDVSTSYEKFWCAEMMI